VEAQIIVDEAGRRQPLREAVAELVAEVAPVASDLGCADELGVVGEILDQGPSYARQRQVVADGGTLVDVVDSLTAELESDRPGAR
jgi:carboxylate-amine ligase